VFERFEDLRDSREVETDERERRERDAKSLRQSTLRYLQEFRFPERTLRLAEQKPVEWWERRQFIRETAEELKRESERPREREISPRTVELYEVQWNQLQREIQVSDFQQVREHLLETVKFKSRSSYSLERAAIMRKADRYVADRIRKLPSYTELCRELEISPTRRVGAVTRARRRTKDERVWNRLLSHLEPADAGAITALRMLGCRAGELAGAEISRDGDAITVSIPTLKHQPGERRVLTFSPSEPECAFLSRYSGRPWAEYDAKRLRRVWSLAREREGLASSPAWCLHALRHDAASRWKAASARQMREKYGPDWIANPDRLEEFRRPVADRLGHGCTKSTSIYGHVHVPGY
jgi:hypothetical protein